MVSVNESTRTVQAVGRMSNQRTLTTMNDLTPVSNPLQVEIWKPIVGFESTYEVSTLGRVRRSAPGKGTKVGRIRKLINDHMGYPIVQFIKEGIPKSFKIHQLVARTFLGDPPSPQYEVNHINGIRTDARLCNLEWVTRSENMKHAYATGLASNKGERNNAAKLTWDQVREIRQMYNDGVKRKQIEKMFPIKFSAIYAITKNNTWKE